MEALAEVAGVCWRSTCVSYGGGSLNTDRILPMSAMTMDSGGAAPPADFQDTALPSTDTETVPSCFLYWAAALDMLVEERGCNKAQAWVPPTKMHHVTH
jgi:hypothetical protein